MRINYGVSADSSLMNARRVSPAVGIVDHPHVAANMVLEYEHVTVATAAPNGHRAGCRRGAREPEPRCGPPQVAPDRPENPHCRATAAKQAPWATSGVPHNATLDSQDVAVVRPVPGLGMCRGAPENKCQRQRQRQHSYSTTSKCRSGVTTRRGHMCCNGLHE